MRLPKKNTLITTETMTELILLLEKNGIIEESGIQDCSKKLKKIICETSGSEILELAGISVGKMK